VSTRKYLLRKLAQALATLAFVLAVNFFLFHALGDPVKLLARSNLHLTLQEQREQQQEFGLDKGLLGQFATYVTNSLTGKFGLAFKSGRPVTQEIGGAMWPTILLVGISTLLSTVFGIIIGIYGAWRRGSFFDKSTLFGSLILYSMPEGWLGMLLLVAFAGNLGWFPTGGYASLQPITGIAHITDVLNHLFLPCMTLTLGYIGEYEVIMRSSLLEVIGEDYVQTARAKGLRDNLVRRRHAVPNALLPTLTLVFYSFGFVLGGAVIIEAVYSWPGLGLLTYRAIADLDYPLLQALFLLLSAAVILFNFAADVMYGYLDPRVKEA
jgi:peptide/nickel transport system permease protein